jgi:cellulose synthase/poly-beta-1,6-N-acetylglucosamine synthase-like glycosyltransferase
MELLFALMCVVALGYFVLGLRHKPSSNFASVDAIIPAYNEAPCLEASLVQLLRNPYIRRVICVNDGSTDDTAGVLARMARNWPDRLVAINQANTGKGGALMNGLRHATADQVFLTDADTRVPHDRNGLGYMLAEIERGADAVGGIPSTNLDGARLLPYIRATVKLPMIAIKRTFQQIVGGAPFIISGACGMFRTDVLLKHGFSDRTKVEDLDLTWTLVAHGYKVRQANRCIVYPQECNTLREEWRRWRRWIAGFAVCMRLHRRLLLSRFGLVSMTPMFGLVVLGIAVYAATWIRAYLEHGGVGIAMAVFPLAWVAVVSVLGAISAWHHRKLRLVPMASLAVFYVFLAYAIWIVHGLAAFFTGREPTRDKPTRYAHVVE